MGQRSQIYIRYNVNCNGCNYKGLIARYFGWNYGERMISRARYVIEEISEEFLRYKYFFRDEEKLEKLVRFCETNFDMKDIVRSLDIIEDVKESAECVGDIDYHDSGYIFDQDNNDGQLFIDVTDSGIKYCFMQFYDEGEPMDGEHYMKWNCECIAHPDWHVPYEYMNEETIAYTEGNIKAIDEMAVLMLPEEIKAFVTDDYSYLFQPQQTFINEFNKNLITDDLANSCKNAGKLFGNKR